MPDSAFVDGYGRVKRVKGEALEALRVSGAGESLDPLGRRELRFRLPQAECDIVVADGAGRGVRVEAERFPFRLPYAGGLLSARGLGEPAAAFALPRGGRGSWILAVSAGGLFRVLHERQFPAMARSSPTRLLIGLPPGDRLAGAQAYAPGETAAVLGRSGYRLFWLDELEGGPSVHEGQPLPEWSGGEVRGLERPRDT